MVCKTFKHKTNKSCINDRKKIVIRKRLITSNATGNLNTTTTFQTLLTAGAFIRTTQGADTYDGVNIIPSTTTEFIVGYTPTLASYVNDQLSILYNNKNFNVDTIENIDMENKNYIFRCTEHGDVSQIANNI